MIIKTMVELEDNDGQDISMFVVKDDDLFHLKVGYCEAIFPVAGVDELISAINFVTKKTGGE